MTTTCDKCHHAFVPDNDEVPICPKCRWARLTKQVEELIYVKYVYVPNGDHVDVNEFVSPEGWTVTGEAAAIYAAIEKGTYQPPQRRKPDWIVRGKRTLTLPASLKGSYTCPTCRLPMTWGDRVCIGKLCYSTGEKIEMMWHPQCVPYHPSVHREYYRTIFSLASGRPPERDYLDSIGPRTVPVSDEQFNEAREAQLAEQAEEAFERELSNLVELTAEEMEIAREKTVEGLTWKEIAARHKLSMRTVAYRMASIEGKLGRKLPKDVART